MFGSRKRTDPADTQIPYEVYETVQQPAAQRRRWVIRLIAALAVITLLIFGFMALSRSFLGTDDKGQPGSGQQQSQSGGRENKPSNNNLKPPDNLQQDPKHYSVPPASDAKPDTVIQGDQTFKSTVTKPE